MKKEKILNNISIVLLVAGIIMMYAPMDCRIPCRIVLIMLCVLEVISFINKLRV